MTQLLVDGEVPLLATGVRHRMHAARNLTVEVVDLIHGVHNLVSKAADLIDEVLDLFDEVCDLANEVWNLIDEARYLILGGDDRMITAG
ncbi:MAG: hypothetical protein ACREO4_08965 [Lysobacter sp.]